MPINQPSSARNAVFNRIRTTGQLLRQSYCRANEATHHVLGWCLKALLLFYFIFCIFFLTLRFAVMPQIENYRVDVEKVASKALGLPVSIGAIAASWDGLRPHLSLREVAIRDRDGRPALTLPGVSATVAWKSLLLADVRLESLEIDRPQLDIQRDTNGHFFIAGLPLNSQKDGDGAVADWVLSQNNITIVDGQVRWQDHLRKTPPLSLQHVDVRLHNSGHTHEFALKAVPPAEFAAPLDIRAKFSHPYFSKKISDVSRWSGQLYADMRNTDLALWKTYLDFPFDLRQAKGSVRAWLKFDHARVADFTADLSLSDVSAQFRKDLQPLELVKVNGRISVRETFSEQEGDGVPTFGSNGHAISLVDFSMQTKDGLILPKTTISERFIASKGNKPQRMEVDVMQLDLQTMSSLVSRLPLSPEHLRMLSDFSPHGQLKNFSAQWDGEYPQIASYQLRGQFSELSLRAQVAPATQQATRAMTPAIPGFDNLTGSINANNKGGTLTLDSHQLKFLLPGYFSNPEMDFDALGMDVAWSFQKNDQLMLDLRKLHVGRGETVASLAGTYLMPLKRQPKTSPGVIDMRGTLTGLPLAQVGDYLPQQLHQEVRTWLTGALVGGTLRDGTIRIKGDLARFPFVSKTAKKSKKSETKAHEEFLFLGRIDDGSMNYDPGFFGRDGKAPLWPLLEKVQGTIKFDRTRMEIDGESGMTQGTQLTKVKAVVPDILADDLMLNIDGHASGALQNFVDYTVASPVAGWIEQFTDETKASGDATLTLKLNLPLNHLVDAKVQGSVKLDKNNVTLMKAMPTMSQASGQLDFNETGLMLKSIKANFIGGPLTLSGGSQKNGDIVIKAAGSLSAAGLNKGFPAASLRKINERISGSSRYSATISVRNKMLAIQAESNLRGLGLDFPTPLRKLASEDLPLKFELHAQPSEQKTVLRDIINLTLGSAISASYQRQKNTADAAPSWHVVRGGIGVNAPAPMPDSGLIANIEMPELNVDDWLQIVSSVSGKGSQAAGTPENATKAAANAETNDMAQYVEPDMIAARATKLTLLGKQLDQVVVGASHDVNVWQANIDATQISGYVTWRESSSGRGLGKVTARLASLIVPKAAKDDVKSLLAQDDTTTMMPALDIVAENFELFGKKLGQLELLAHYVRAPTGREWSIKKLSLQNQEAVLTASGKWLAMGTSNTSSLDYKLEIKDAGKLLGRFGFENVLRAGKGSMSGDINWQGTPFSLDVPSLSGTIKLNVSSGQFLKVDPGAAKLLGVLSLQSIPRRLTLDFRDVFSTGFAFDDVTGTADIKNGVATTDSLKMRGVTATVLMDGSADIAKETQDLHVVVIPEINAGAASVAYALAINPVIGVGTFLAQLFLREPLAKAFTFEYKVTGPWVDPVVTKIDRKVNQTSNADGKQEPKPDAKREQEIEAVTPLAPAKTIPSVKVPSTIAPLITPSMSNNRTNAPE